MTNEQLKIFWSRVDDGILQNAVNILSTWKEEERKIIEQEHIKRKLKEV